MKLRRSMGVLLTLIMLVSIMTNMVMAESIPIILEGEEIVDIYKIISSGIGTSTSYLQEQLTELHEDGGVSYGFEWYMISMLRAGKTIDEDILNEYYESVTTEVSGWDSDVKPTDIERTALALTLMDKDITNINGVNLAELIYNSARLSEGANELAYALIVLDAAEAEVPDTALWNKEKIIEELLKFQASDGGFGLNDNSSSDVDMTAISLQALSPYKEIETVNEAIDKAFIYLKDSISSDYNYLDNVNTTAQVLLAVATLKIDVTDSNNEFGDEFDNIITALEGYRNTEGNGYLYEDNTNAMATVQVMQAYDAYRKAHKEGITYWDFATEGDLYDDEVNEDNSDCEEDTEAAEPINMYVTIASDGTIVRGKDNGYVTQAIVTVTDRDSDGILTVDEALYATHEKYYEGGAEAGYNTFEGQYGLSLGMLWGEGTPGVTASAGYWLNNVSCWSLEDPVKEGDYLTAFNYYDALGYSDSYSYFEENEVTVEQGASVTLTLNAIGYDANWNTVVEPYLGAKVIFLESNNSAQKTFTTDNNGQVKISFNNSSSTGSYYVMAYKEDGTIVPAVCKINVIENNVSSGGSTSKNISVKIRVADPKGTTFLNKTLYSVEKGTSAYELLQETGLDLDVTRSAYGVYVKAIEGLSEFDEGNESGWMYRVNGKFPNYSASLYALSKGDYVEWLYTRNGGDDIGETSFSSASSSSSRPKDKGKKEEQEEEKQKEEIQEEQEKQKEEIQEEQEKTEVEEKNMFSETTFDDVKQDDWHYESVKYVYENNLMRGTGNGFEPDNNMTRAMLVTVLFNIEKTDKTTFSHTFIDVPSDEWYNNSVAWAYENNIVAGIGENEFAPDENLSREQMMTIIYRYAKMKGYIVDSKSDLSQYKDTDIISDWAMEAVEWSNAVELVRGTSDTTLSPLDGATRAEVATILMKFCENIKIDL